jgi:hypothetical protein
LSVTANADYAFTSGSVTIDANSNITGANSDGIFAKNSGSGAVVITPNGDITGFKRGIYAHEGGTDLTITTGGTVTGTKYVGISAYQLGSGVVTVTANGDVTSGGANVFHSGIGIYARNNYGADLIVTTKAGTTVTGSGNYSYGILAGNFGSGALTITTNGDVIGGRGGIGVRKGNHNSACV